MVLFATKIVIVPFITMSPFSITIIIAIAAVVSATN
jgi:hypothetical protein